MFVCVSTFFLNSYSTYVWWGKIGERGGVLGIGVLYVLGEWILNFFFFFPLILFCIRSRFFRNAMGREM